MVVYCFLYIDASPLPTSTPPRPSQRSQSLSSRGQSSSPRRWSPTPHSWSSSPRSRSSSPHSQSSSDSGRGRGVTSHGRGRGHGSSRGQGRGRGHGSSGGHGRGGVTGTNSRGHGRGNAPAPWIWTTTKSPTNVPATFSFVGDCAGPNNEAVGVRAPADCFDLFLGTYYDELLVQTNLYAEQQRVAKGDTSPWSPISKEELLAFIGLNIAMGIISLPSLDDYWSTDIIRSHPSCQGIGFVRFYDTSM